MLQIRLLGQFDVRLNGKRILIPSRAGQSLLAYLTLTAGTPHRREVLSGILWPDFSEETARKNLRHELWRIRKALAGPNQVTEYLLADEFSIAFNRNADYWLDATQLERPDLDIQSLSSNLSLYQGELLPGFFEDWIVLERERIQTIFETKMEQLLNQLVAAERWIAVQEQGERWLSFGNSPEPAYRALMLAHGARGDVTKVSSVYQRCMTDLDEKFGLEPSAETRALYDGLLKGTQTPARSAIIQQAGTITFLFTDIEESTSLLDKLGDQYANVLTDHHKIMRAAIQKWNGHEVDTQGDAFFVTFTRALDAIQCAAEAQTNLASHPWTHGKLLHVRMGLHTGEPLIAATGYVGMDVHRAARIGDAAHGGQVLLSHTTRELIINNTPNGLSVRDLGEYRLKDLKFPTPIYQLVIDGLTHEFPPLRTKFSGSEAPTPGEPPFKGLQYFDEMDSDLFFGREVLTAKLIGRLRESQFLSVIIGASGSGKSSVVRAGVIPSLKKGATLIDGSNPPEDSPNWRVHVFTPTAHPLEALATELTHDSESVTATATLMDDLMQDPRSLGLYLARQKPQRHTLLVLDQFEELFTLCRDEFEREAFIDNLLTTLSDESRTTIIITLRADFYAHLAQYPELRDAVAHQQEYIGPMTIDELRRAIEEPAKRAHWVFEPGLVDLILRDVGDEPGALPLLSHALLETWKRRAGHTLTLKGYADAGGVRGAISHTAESVYQNLSAAEQVIARNIFLRLTELGEGTEDTRRRASFDELMSHMDNAEETDKVLNRLAEARLVTLSENTAEVAHEALIREWHTLREWLNQDREGLRLHRNITEGAQEWELLEHDPGTLYRGARLSQAREWAALHPNALNADEKAFVEASDNLEKQEQAEHEAQQQRELEAARKLAETERQSAIRMRIRNRVITAVGIVAIILAVLAASFSRQSSINANSAEKNAQSALSAQAEAEINAEAANQAKADAEAQGRIAFARELAASADNTLTIDPELSILLALQGVETTKVDSFVLPEVENALHRAIAASRVKKTFKGQQSWFYAMTFSPDGSLLATGGHDKTLNVWDASTYENVLTLNPHNTDVNSISFSPDGTRMATSGDDGMAKIWDVKTGQLLLEIEHTSWVVTVAFNPDGKQLVTYGFDKTVKFWDAETGKNLKTWATEAEPTGWLSYSPDGQRVYFEDAGKLKAKEVSTGEEIYSVPVGDGTFAVSPDNKHIAVKDPTTTVIQIRDASTGELIFNTPHPSNHVETMKFSPDGSLLAIGGRDRKIHIWDVNYGTEVLTFVGHTEFIFSLAFSPDGKHLLSGAGDGSIKIWSLEPSREVVTIPNVSPNRFALSPDGTRIAVNGNFDPTSGALTRLELWDAGSGDLIFEQAGHDNRGMGVSFSPDGQSIVTGGSDQLIKMWDSGNGKLIWSIPVEDKTIYGIAYQPDGKVFAAVGTSGKVQLFDHATGKLLKSWEAGLGQLSNAVFSPDGTRLAVISPEVNDAKVFDANTGEELLVLIGHTNSNWGVDFNSDGTRLVTAGRDATARIWDAETGELLFIITGHTSTISWVRFSPDDKQIATGSADGTVRLWDALSGKQLLEVAGSGNSVEFTPDGERLVAPRYRVDGIQIIALTIEELVQIAKSRLTRTFTLEECQKYLHMETCPSE